MLLDYKILAVDFDGTLCEERWPEIGHPNHEIINHVKNEKENGAKLILWTCRIGKHLGEAVEWCKGHGIEFDAVNDNIPDIYEMFPVNGPKIYYDELIDDKHNSQFILPYLKSTETKEEKSESQSWAEREIAIACQYEREGNNSEDDEWDYGVACYESALKAYRSLCEDEHSGFSICLTQQVLNRLLEHKPLTAIEDIPDIWDVVDERNDKEKYTCMQCTRMSSLFKYVYGDGTVKYKDMNNNVGVDIHTRSSYGNYVIQKLSDELYPVTMPYYPGEAKVFYSEEFLFDEKNGDYDTIGVFYVRTSDGKRTKLNRFFKETKTGWKKISRLEYMFRKVFEIHKGDIVDDKN